MWRYAATLFLAVLLFSVPSGCVTYDRPKLIKPPTIKVADLVPYKKLTRDDFRATTPPENISELSRAAVCTQIVLSPYSRMRINPIQSEGGRQKYEATLIDPRFYAVVNRGCSWWNPDFTDVKNHDEILEHEQVHFAITELAARELNRRVAEIIQEVRALGNTPAEAIAGIKADFFVRVRQEFLKHDEKFDEETAALFASRTRQKEWLGQVEAELRDTQVYAEGPSSEARIVQLHDLLDGPGRP